MRTSYSETVPSTPSFRGGWNTWPPWPGLLGHFVRAPAVYLIQAKQLVTI